MHLNQTGYKNEDLTFSLSFDIPRQVLSFLQEKTGEEWIFSNGSRGENISYRISDSEYKEIQHWQNIERKNQYTWFSECGFLEEKGIIKKYSCDKGTTSSYDILYNNILDGDISEECSYETNDNNKNIYIYPDINALKICKYYIINQNNNKIKYFYICCLQLHMLTYDNPYATPIVYHFHRKKDIEEIENTINESRIDEIPYINPYIFPKESEGTEERIINIFHNKSILLRQKHLPVQLGIMISGLPGTGKSMYVKHLSDKVKHLFKVKYSFGINDLSSMCLNGEDLPSNALLIFDDIECVLRERIDGGENATILSWLLNQFDNGDKNTNRLFILVTNHVEPIDDALKRPGRIDYHIKFDKPSQKDMQTLLKFHTGDDITDEQSINIIKYLREKIDTSNFADISLLCRLIYTDIDVDISDINRWYNTVDFMSKTSAYEGKKVKQLEKTNRKMGF